jgi:NAD(P)-dependent dehydrogenase (short-subunit alcohol dehydrogenase family)
MKKTIVVCGHGPGISDAVARKFGKSGFQVAIVARSQDKLEAAAGRLRDEGIVAKAFPCDLGDAAAVKALFADVESALGPATVLLWNVYTGGAGDLLTAPDAELQTVLSVAVNGLVAATQCVVPKMQKGEGAILVTGGGFAFYDEAAEKMATDYQCMGLAIGKAAQHKTTRLLHGNCRPGHLRGRGHGPRNGQGHRVRQRQRQPRSRGHRQRLLQALRRPQAHAGALQVRLAGGSELQKTQLMLN